jgi:hypothetical protein
MSPINKVRAFRTLSTSLFSFFPCFPLVNNQPQLSLVLHYSYRLDGVKLSGGNFFVSINMLNMRRIFLFDEDSLQSSSSSIAPSQSTTTTSTESSFFSSSNSENLNPTANLNLNDSLTEPTTTTFNDYSFPSSGTQGSSDGIFQDHPGLNPFNPSSERIVELHSDIHDKLGELMINRSPQDVLVAAEALHGESDNISFIESLLNDLNRSGVQGEAYTEALDLAGLVPSPLEQFSILPLIPMNIGNLYFSFTNSSLFMLLTLSLVLLLVLVFVSWILVRAFLDLPIYVINLMMNHSTSHAASSSSSSSSSNEKKRKRKRR